MPRTPTDDSLAWAPTLQDDEHRAAPEPETTRVRRRVRRVPRWRAAAAAAVAVLVVAAATWLVVRNVRTPAPPAPPPATAPATGGPRALSLDQLRRSIEQATERVQKDPRDTAGWAMLAHSQAMLGDFEAARKTYARLAELLPTDAQVLADYADAVGVAQGRRLAGEPVALIQRALELDPKNLKALALAGREAFERKDYAQAIGFWERARAVAGDGAVRAEIEANIAEARAFDGRERPPDSVVRKAGGATVSGRVTLAAELRSKVSPDDAVFVFARPVKGSRMPVALLRKKVSDLPLAFTLDDSLAMVPDIRLSMLATVAVGARVSRRGDAVPQPGDLQGLVDAVELGTQDVVVEIREVLK